MKYDPVSKGVVPALSGKDLIEAVPGLGKIADIETVEFCNIDSSQMTPEIWRELSAKVAGVLKRADVKGVVITHGTDTMEEGAFLRFPPAIEPSQMASRGITGARKLMGFLYARF